MPAGLLLQNGNTITPTAEQHTAAPTKLKPPEQYEGGGIPIWEYASAPFAISIAPGLIAPGNDVLIVQTGHSAYVTKVAQACPDQRTWSGRVWNTVQQGDVAVAQPSAKKLTFTLGTGGTSDLQGTYYTDCTIAGALTAKVHYTLNTWPSTNGVRVGLLVNNPDYAFTPGSVTAERTSFAASGDVDTGEKYAANGTDSGGGFVTKPTSATSVSALPQAITTWSTETGRPRAPGSRSARRRSIPARSASVYRCGRACRSSPVRSR